MDKSIWEKYGYKENQESVDKKPNRSLFDNIGDALTAIGANFTDVRATGNMGDLRQQLFEPDENMTDEEYYAKKEEYQRLRAEREAARQEYAQAHGSLVADDSFLKNIDQMGGTLEGMAAQGIGTAVGAGLGFLSPVVGGTAMGAKYGNAAGAVVGGFLDARSVALQAQEEVLEAGGTWEQAKEAYDNALLKASFTTLPETAADIVMGNRLIRAGLGSGVARKIAGSTVGRAGSAVLDPAKNIGTVMSRAFNPIVGRLSGLATDVAAQGITEAGQEVTQDYIANREVAKALGQQDNEYSLEGFKDYALSDQGLETMKTAGIMGALFGGVGGTLSSGQYLQHGAKTRQGNATYRAVKNLENDGKFAINADNREAEVKTLAEILRRDGVDENTIRSWSDAELAAASAEVRGKYISKITDEAQDQSIIRQGADTVNRFFSTDEDRQLREGDVNNPMREYLHAVGVDDDAIARMFTTQGIEKSVVQNAKEQVEKQEDSEQAKAKLTQPTIDSMEQEQQQSGTERKTDGVIDDFALEFGNENNIGEKWEPVTQGDVQYVDTAIYINRDTGRIVSVQKTQDGKVQVVDHGLSSNPENLFNLDNINSLPMKQYSSAKEAKQRLLENEDNKNDFRWMGKEQGEEQTDTKDNDLDKTRVANDIDSFIKLRQQKPWLIDDKLLLEFSAIMQRAGMTKDAKIDYYFLLDQASEKGYGQRYTTDEGKAIVELYLGADIGTVVHELGHGAYWNLSQEDRNIFNKYAVKSCGEYIANIIGEDYDQNFVNRLQNYKKDKEFWNKMREHGAVYQTMFLLESFQVMSQRQTDQRGINRFMELRQQAIEERFAWEFSQWYVQGYAKGVQPSNAITRITQRGCFTVADKLNRIQQIWEYIHHRGGDYGDTPIESMYANAELGYTGNRYADLRDSSDLWLNETMNPPIVKPVKQEPVKQETTKQQKQTKQNKEEKQPKQTYTEEQKAQNKEDEKIQNRKTVDVQGRYKEQQKEKVSDIIGEFDQKSQNEVDKLVDIVKNKKSGWQKALQKLSNYSPSLYMDKLNGIQSSSNESTLDAYTKTYGNNNAEVKETPAPQVKENPTPTQNTKQNTKKNNQKAEQPTQNNQAKQNELFNQVEQKDPTLGKDGMAVYNKLKDKEKLSDKDKKEIQGIINRIDALGKQHRYGALRKTLSNVLNGVKEEPTPKQNTQTVSSKPKTLGDSPAGRAVKLIKRLEKKKFLDTEEADYYANEFLGAAIDLKNWDKDFDGKQGLINQLNDIAEKIKSGEYFGEEIEEEESTQSNEEQTNDTKEKTQESAPVVENTQPTVQSQGQEQEETQETQSNNEPQTDNRAERIKEELIKNGIPRQQKNRLRAYLSNGDITQEQHDAIYNELFPKQEETNKQKTSSSKMKHCIAYVKDKDGNYSTIKEDFRTQKDFKKSLVERGYEVIINTDNEDLFNERLAKYKDALEMQKERDRQKAEEQARREAEAQAKAEAKAKADEEKARLAQEAAAKEAEKAQKEANEKKAAEEAAAKAEQEKKDAEEAKKKKLEETIEKFKNQPLPDNIVDQVFGKTDEFFKYDPKIGEFVGYYKQVDDPQKVNSVTGKPLKKMELSGIVDAKTYYKILDKWETLSYSDKEKMTTPIRGIPEFKLKSFATGHGYVRPKVQTEVKNETKVESKSTEEANNKNVTEPPTLTDKEIEKIKRDEQKRRDNNNKKKGAESIKSLKKKFKNITGGEIGTKTIYKADEKQFIRVWIDRIDDAILFNKETLNNISNSLDEWKQNNINQKRTEVIYNYINNYIIEAGKQFPESVQKTDARSQSRTEQKRNSDSRYMAIGEIGIDSPLKNEEFMEKLETRWEHSYRIAGYKYGYTKKEINQSLEKYRGVEKEKVFDAIEDKLAKIYIDLNRAANMSIWKPQSKEIAPLDFQRGLDGKWRFYISDKDMKLKVSLKQLKAITNTGKQLKLKDIVKHDSLFKYYPQLGDINVEINDSKYDKTLKDNTYGYYEKQSNTIVFNNEFLNRKNNLEETLLHEVQHAIQHIEGFAIGGAEESIKNNPKQLDAFAQSVWNRKEEFRKYLEDNTRYNKGTIEHKVDEIFITPKVIRNRISSVLGNGIFMSNAERDFKKWITSDNKLFEEYASLLGEMEARDAEKRLNFKTEEEWRKNVPLISDKYYRNASYGQGRITSVTDSRSQSKKSKRKQEERERIQKEIEEAKEKGEVTDTYKDVYSVSFDKEAQQNTENQKKIEYFEKKRQFWERHESNGLVTYTRKNPFEHHKKTIKYTGINGIESKEKEKSKLGKWYEWAKDQMIKYWFNDKQYLAKAARKLGVYDAYVRMMVTEGYAQRANVALTEGIMYNGKRTRALNDIIREVGYDKQRRFLDYCIAHRIKDLKNRDPEILQKMSVEEADEIIEDIKNSEYADLFENNRIDFVDYNKALLHVLVDGGIYSEEDFQKFCDNDPNFVPLAKVMDDADMGFNSIIHAHSLINAKKPIKRIGTSMREIKNPFLEMQKRTAEYYSIAARNRAGQIFVNEICGHLDRMFDDDVSVARGQGLIREVKVDEQNGRLITRPDDKKQIIYVCDNGKHRFYQVADREIYLALKSLNDDQMNTLWRMIDNVAHKPAKWIRESATIVPDFGVRNLIRDNAEAFLTSEHGFFPFFDALWGMYQMANNTEWYQRYLDQVGEYGTLNRDNERTLATYSSTIDDKISYTKNLSEIYKQQMAIIKDTDRAYKEFINEKNSPQKKAMAAVKLFISPIWAGGKTLKRFNDYMEQGTRIGEFKNAKKNYNGFLDRMGRDAFKWDIGFDSLNDNSDIMAAGAAKEITLNFSQHGIWGKQLNRWIPFFNATLQGLYKFGNTMDLLFKGNDMSNQKNRRLQKELAFKVAMLAAFGIGTAAAGEGDEDYEEAPEYEKQNFWIFPNGIRIPKDQVLGTLIGTAFEQGYTQWRKGKTKPSEILNTIIEHFKPNSIIPAIVDIWGLGFVGNYDSFKKQQIVPEWLKNKRGFLQKDINTSYFASRVSEVLYKTIGADISAKKIDYAIQKNFSNSAKYFNAVIDLAFSDNEKMARGYDKSDSTGEFVGGLRDKVPSPFSLVTGTFATNRTQFKSVDDFYKRYNELKIASSNEESMTREEKREWKRYQDAYKKDTKLRKQLKAIKQNKSLSGAQKREQADKIFKQQIKLAKWAEG